MVLENFHLAQWSQCSYNALHAVTQGGIQVFKSEEVVKCM